MKKRGSNPLVMYTYPFIYVTVVLVYLSFYLVYLVIKLLDNYWHSHSTLSSTHSSCDHNKPTQAKPVPLVSPMATAD